MKKDYFKIFCDVLFTIIPGGITYYDKIKPIGFLGFKVFWYSLTVFLFIGFYQIFKYFHLRKVGVRGCPFKFKLFLKKFNPAIVFCYAKTIHEFQHEISKAQIDIKNNNEITPITNTSKKRTAELMQKMANSLKIITGVDFSVNIKLFEANQINIDSGVMSIDKSLLVTYERIASEKEKLYLEKKGISERLNHEKFLVEKIPNMSVSSVYNLCENYARIHFKHKRNTAYDIALGSNEGYWLSNNLGLDEINKCYFSTSQNYKDYYNSLGVFVIGRPGCSCSDKNNHTIIGLLIIDTIETNVFHTLFIKELMGYFSHRFYDYFVSYPILSISKN